ncbi:hypothetical protein G6F22_014495 [Rhizopus arrhizus]|nr:hypothetical protein G6F22_014495 [Rhizopus arrhizus]
MKAASAASPRRCWSAASWRSSTAPVPPTSRPSARFAVDRIHKARVVDSTARDVADSELDEQLGASYGIFSGAPKGWATILFSAKAARWVADEHWHSKQQGRFLADGRYELKVPYSVSRELLMDVLHYGSDAEIVEPNPTAHEEDPVAAPACRCAGPDRLRKIRRTLAEAGGGRHGRAARRDPRGGQADPQAGRRGPGRARVQRLRAAQRRAGAEAGGRPLLPDRAVPGCLQPRPQDRPGEGDRRAHRAVRCVLAQDQVAGRAA